MKKKINYHFVKDRPSHDMRYSLNSKKFAKDYKWKPKFNLLSGLKDTVEWYLQNKSWLEETFKRYKGQRLGDV
jgi:dTDP-glucose 4,6-dehydratase